MDINNIQTLKVEVRELGIGPIDIWVAPEAQTPVVPSVSPVTTVIGVPVVDIPGCVEAHEVSDNNKNAVTDDPKGAKTYCDAGVPSFNPMDYNKEQLQFQKPATPSYKGESPKPPPPEPATDAVNAAGKVTTAVIQCPTQEQLSKEPIGFIFDSGRKEITGYRLEGTQCIREVSDVPLISQALNGLPPAGTVITTGGIAVVATTSALLAKPFADILLKVIKPTVKKVMKKVAAIRGKQLAVLSVEERRAEQRDRNQAIAKLKSVAAKTKKK